MFVFWYAPSRIKCLNKWTESSLTEMTEKNDALFFFWDLWYGVPWIQAIEKLPTQPTVAVGFVNHWSVKDQATRAAQLVIYDTEHSLAFLYFIRFSSSWIDLQYCSIDSLRRNCITSIHVIPSNICWLTKQRRRDPFFIDSFCLTSLRVDTRISFWVFVRGSRMQQRIRSGLEEWTGRSIIINQPMIGISKWAYAD